MKKTTFKKYELACKFLKRNPKNLPIVSKLPQKYRIRQVAQYKLEVMAEATNLKNDNFIPDYSNSNQDKWFPIFIHNGKKGKAAAFRFVSAIYSWAHTCTTGGSRLVFSSEAEAISFGKNNIKLYNNILL